MTTPLPAATDLVLDFLSTAKGGRMSAQDLCRAGGIMGLAEPVVRVALTRLARQEKIHKTERGVYAFHPAYRPLPEDVGHWRARLGWIAAWKGGWVGVQDAGLSGGERTIARRHQRALALRGFRQWKPGLHLRPDNLRGGVDAMRAQLADLGLRAQAEVFALSGLDRAQARAAQGLWNAAALKAGYVAELKRLAESERRLARLGPEAAAREGLLVGRAVIAQIVRDPLLPEEILGGNERGRLVAAMTAYQTRSLKVWAAILGSRDLIG